jgi:hypothetical protein
LGQNGRIKAAVAMCAIHGFTLGRICFLGVGYIAQPATTLRADRSLLSSFPQRDQMVAFVRISATAFSRRGPRVAKKKLNN